jgi:diaminopimelate decarboxylase
MNYKKNVKDQIKLRKEIVSNFIKDQSKVESQKEISIKTGINENKFGISTEKLIDAVQEIDACSSIELIGLHFHIGSQITNFRNFEFSKEIQKDRL